MEQSLTIDIDEYEKLRMTWHIHNHLYFEDEDLVIKDVSLNARQEPYKLLYYHEADLKVKGGGEIRMEVFMAAEFKVEREGRSHRVKKMVGKWYDLNKEITKFSEQKIRILNPQFSDALPNWGEMELIRRGPLNN